MTIRLIQLAGSFALALVILALHGAPLFASGEPTPDFVLISRTEWFADGNHKTTHLAVNAIPNAAPNPEKDRGFAADFRQARAVPSAQVDFDVRWPFGSKIDYHMNSKAKPSRKRINRVLKQHVNKPRGTGNVPTQKATTKPITIIPIGTFSNRNDYYFQTFLNEHSDIVMTTDDQFFREPSGGQLINPGQMALTVTISLATLSQEGGRTVGDLAIAEADVFLRSDFFGQPNNAHALILAGIFRTTLGYPNNLWVKDLLGHARPYITQAAFNNKKSEVWQQARERDRTYYSNSATAASTLGAAKRVEVMLPLPGTVLDIGGDQVLPVRVAVGLQSNARALVVTNLRGLQRLMVVRISRIQNGKRSLITKLKGKTRNYPVDTPGVGKWYPKVFLSRVGFNRQKELDKVKKALRQHGQPMTIAGYSWQKALEVEILVTGGAEPSGGGNTVKQRYFLVNSDEEPAPAN